MFVQRESPASVRKLLELAVEVPPLVVKKRLAVGDQVLQVANLRPVDRRVVDFADDARGQREPDAARGRIGRADRLLVAARPARARFPGAEGCMEASSAVWAGVDSSGKEMTIRLGDANSCGRSTGVRKK